MNPYPIRMRVSVQGDSALIKALLTHPMDNGLSRDSGAPGPAHFITELVLTHNGAECARIDTGSGIASDPLFGWRLKGVKVGDKIGVAWRDNQGLQHAFETTAQ